MSVVLFKKDRHLESFAMVSGYYRRQKRLNETQLVRFAEIVGDVAQITFAAFFLPLFVGETTFLRAFSGGSIAILLWLCSISLVRSCRN